MFLESSAEKFFSESVEVLLGPAMSAAICWPLIPATFGLARSSTVGDAILTSWIGDTTAHFGGVLGGCVMFKSDWMSASVELFMYSLADETITFNFNCDE
jgi:hypothetical protein